MIVHDDALADYEIASDKSRVVTEYLLKVYKKLFGDELITDIHSDSAIAFIEILIRCWRDLYPNEYEGRLLQQKKDWIVERTVAETNKTNGGFFLVSFPPRLWSLFRFFFPNVKWTTRKNSNLLTENFPILKGTQYKT